MNVHPLIPSFSARLAEALPMMQDARAVFCDLALRQTDGVFWPLLFPAFDTERLLEQGLRRLVALPLPEADVSAQIQTIEAPSSLVALLLEHLAPGGGMPDLTGVWHLPHPGGWAEYTTLAATCGARAKVLEAALRQPGRLPAGSQITPEPTYTGALFPALHLHRPVTDRRDQRDHPHPQSGADAEHRCSGSDRDKSGLRPGYNRGR